MNVTIEEYLSDPKYERWEYVDGHAVPFVPGGLRHSRTMAACGASLDRFVPARPGCYAAMRLHCRLEVDGEPRFRLPEIAVVLDDDSTEERYLDRAPDLVVEIRSPDDSVSALSRKMDEYFANGARLGWLVLPEEKSVLVFAPEGRVRTAVEGDVLDGGNLLPDLKLPVEELFA